MPVIILLAVIMTFYVIVSHFYEKRNEAKGICPTTGGSCTSPSGCTCANTTNIPKE